MFQSAAADYSIFVLMHFFAFSTHGQMQFKGFFIANGRFQLSKNASTMNSVFFHPAKIFKQR
jgi:hypothetical protein